MVLFIRNPKENFKRKEEISKGFSFAQSQKPSFFGKKEEKSAFQKKFLPQSKPKSLFEEKKEWSRQDIKKRIEKDKPYISGPGGEIYSREERKKLWDTLFPENRFQSRISLEEAKIRLRELKKQEYETKNYQEKIKLSRLREFLENETGLKGKY